jgi:hypothetical protein
MKIATLLLVVFATCVTSAQSSVIAQWDWNNLKDGHEPNLASCVAPGVQVTDLGVLGLKEDFHPTGGVDDSAFRSYVGWGSDFTAEPGGRTDLAPAHGTLWFDVSFSPLTEGEISSFDFCFSQLDAGSPRQMQASLFWLNTEGKVEWASTGAYTPTTTPGVNTDFTCVSLPFIQYSSPIPSGAALAGQTVHVEFQAWGGSSDALSKGAPGALALENITLSGAASVVPEPGSAMLLASLGLLVMLRRHRHLLRSSLRP